MKCITRLVLFYDTCIYYRIYRLGNTLRGKNGLHAFGTNSAVSEPIWMKSGTV